MQKLTDITRRHEKIYSTILSFSFDEEEEYFKSEAYFQKLQQQLIESFSEIRKVDMSIDLQKGFRIILQMIDNARNLLQYQFNLRKGKAYYLENKINVNEFLDHNIQRSAWEKMDLTISDLSVNQKMAFFMLTNVMLQFRQFFVDLAEKMLNKKSSKEMAENLVDKCSIVPYFEDENAKRYESFDKFLESLPADANPKLVKIEPSSLDHYTEDEEEKENDF
jgi:hypothetical protein